MTDVCTQDMLDAAQLRRDKKRAYYVANREALLEKKREYYAKNAEVRRAYNRDYYNKNRESLVTYSREHWNNNAESRNSRKRELYSEDADYRERLKESARRWREANAAHLEAQKAAHASNPAVKLLRTAEARARRAGVDFNLEQVDVQVPTHCPILGIPLRVNTGKVGPNSPSLDRVHPDKGYVKGNVQVVSYKANTMKHNATPQELLAFANWSTTQFGLYGERLTKEEMELRRKTGQGI